MEDKIEFTHVALAGILAAGAQVWGQIGWLIALWIACFVVDYITGSLAAFRSGTWDSTEAREGLWHKGAMITVVLVGALFDLAIVAITHSAGIQLPFDVLVLPIVLAWYIITELGSILENAIKMGAQHVPQWLRKGLKIVSDAVDNAGEKAVGKKSDESGKQ